MSGERVSSTAAAPVKKGGRRVAPPEKRTEQAPRKGKAGLVIVILLAVLIAAYGGLCAVGWFGYDGKALPRTAVLGVDVSGMRADEIETLWQSAGEKALEGAAVELTRSGEVIYRATLAELGVSVSPQEVSGVCAENHGGFDIAAFLQGGYRLAYGFIAGNTITPPLAVDRPTLTAACESLSDTLNCTLVDGDWRLTEGEGLYITKPRDGEKLDSDQLAADLTKKLTAGDLTAVECVYTARKAATVDVAALHEELKGSVVSAKYDKSTGRVTPSQVGVTFDIETVEAQLGSAEAGTEFLVDAEVAFPAVSTEDMEDGLFRDVLGTSTTYCSGPWGRRQNIKLAAKAINGNVYNPGEEFWYNSAVGQRTEARGFQPAAAYSGGKTVTSIGGGICQVSSTLYYAALLGDLDIVLRYAHMFDPGYMPVTGCDATVSWGGPDFAFRNSTDYPIKLVTSYNDETNELTVTILGTKTDDSYVVMTNQFLSYEDFKIIYRESESVASGEQVVDQYGHNGYAVRTYRNVYSGDGTLLRSTTEATSDYDRGDKIILVAPGEIPE